MGESTESTALSRSPEQLRKGPGLMAKKELVSMFIELLFGKGEEEDQTL